MPAHTDNPLMLILIISFLLSALLSSLRGEGGDGRTGKRHAKNRRIARRTARRIRRNIAESTVENAVKYLRTVPPFVFEELTLDAFERNGYRAVRNKRYTADGGIDGRLRKRGRRYLVQCKRYKGYISAADVEDFGTLCRDRGVRGFFVHTGKAGSKSLETGRNFNVKLIDGPTLVLMLTRR